MIVLDIETSGGTIALNRGIWQIGAIELENPKNTFLEEARIEDSDFIEPVALKVTGTTEQYLRDKKKQSEKQLLTNFFSWIKKIKNKDLLCHNPQFDYTFIRIKADKHKIEFPFKYRQFDLHSVAAVKYFELNKTFLLNKDNFSDMGLSNILKMCGIEDTRISLEGMNVKREGTPHNALNDAKLEAEAFSRIVFGKPLLKEFSQFKIPDYLKQI